MPTIRGEVPTLVAGRTYSIDSILDYTLTPGAYNEAIALVQPDDGSLDYQVGGAPADSSTENGRPVYAWRFQIAGAPDPELDGTAVGAGWSGGTITVPATEAGSIVLRGYQYESFDIPDFDLWNNHTTTPFTIRFNVVPPERDPGEENRPPVANADYFEQGPDIDIWIGQARVVQGNLLANDTDADGDRLTSTGAVADPRNGTLVGPGEYGNFTYIPNADFWGLRGQPDDVFQYRVSDERGGESVATVIIELRPVTEYYAEAKKVHEEAEAKLAAFEEVAPRLRDHCEDIIELTGELAWNELQLYALNQLIGGIKVVAAWVAPWVGLYAEAADRVGQAVQGGDALEEVIDETMSDLMKAVVELNLDGIIGAVERGRPGVRQALETTRAAADKFEEVIDEYGEKVENLSLIEQAVHLWGTQRDARQTLEDIDLRLADLREVAASAEATLDYFANAARVAGYAGELGI